MPLGMEVSRALCAGEQIRGSLCRNQETRIRRTPRAKIGFERWGLLLSFIFKKAPTFNDRFSNHRVIGAVGGPLFGGKKVCVKENAL